MTQETHRLDPKLVLMTTWWFHHLHTQPHTFKAVHFSCIRESNVVTCPGDFIRSDWRPKESGHHSLLGLCLYEEGPSIDRLSWT